VRGLNIEKRKTGKGFFQYTKVGKSGEFRCTEDPRNFELEIDILARKRVDWDGGGRKMFLKKKGILRFNQYVRDLSPRGDVRTDPSGPYMRNRS